MIGDTSNLIYEFDVFRLESGERRLLKNGEPVSITNKSFNVLLVLVQNRGRLISKEELIKAVWEDKFIEESNLTVTVSMLRKVLGESNKKRFIENIPKLGYRFIENVEVISETVGENQSKYAVSGFDGEINFLETNDFQSIAVMPFVNSTDNPNLDYFCEKITESLINDLAQFAQLRVIAKNVISQFKDKYKTSLEVGRSLEVKYILEGIVFSHNEQLIIRSEFIEANSGWQIWGGNFSYPFEDYSATQTEVVRQISQKIQAALISEEKKKTVREKHTENTAAYNAYLMGRYCWNKRTNENFFKAINYFTRAIELDKNYMLAYIGLSDCYNLLGAYGALPPKKAMPKMRAALETALQLDGESCEAHTSIGYIHLLYDWNRQAAERQLEIAIKLNPKYITARHWYADCLMFSGHFEEAMEQRRIALEIEPLSLSIRASIASQLIVTENYGKALEIADEILELDPFYPSAHSKKAFVYALQGKIEKAVESAEECFRLSGDLETLALIGYVYAEAGEREKALEFIANIESKKNLIYTDPSNIAVIRAALGEIDETFRLLDKAFEEKSSYLTWFHLDPRIKNLRSDPRLGELFRRVWADSKA